MMSSASAVVVVYEGGGAGAVITQHRNMALVATSDPNSVRHPLGMGAKSRIASRTVQLFSSVRANRSDHCYQVTPAQVRDAGAQCEMSIQDPAYGATSCSINGYHVEVTQTKGGCGGGHPGPTEGKTAAALKRGSGDVLIIARHHHYTERREGQYRNRLSMHWLPSLSGLDVLQWSSLHGLTMSVGSTWTEDGCGCSLQDFKPRKHLPGTFISRTWSVRLSNVASRQSYDLSVQRYQSKAPFLVMSCDSPQPRHWTCSRFDLMKSNPASLVSSVETKVNRMAS